MSPTGTAVDRRLLTERRYAAVEVIAALSLPCGSPARCSVVLGASIAGWECQRLWRGPFVVDDRGWLAPSAAVLLPITREQSRLGTGLSQIEHTNLIVWSMLQRA